VGDDFGAAPESGVVLHVRPGAAAGDGSRARPFGSLGEAATVAPSGATILLSRGAHALPAPIGSVTLRGACARETSLAGPLLLPSGDLALEDLSFEIPLASEGRAGRLRMTGVVVSGAGELRANDVEIADVVAFNDDVLPTLAAIDSAIDLRVDGLALGGSVVFVGLRAGGTVDARRVSVTATQSFLALSAADAKLREIAIAETSRGLAVDARTVDIADVSIRDLRAMDSANDYAGVAVLGAAGVVERVSVLDVVGAGLIAGDPRTSLTVRDLYVDGVSRVVPMAADDFESSAVGVASVDRGHLTVERFLVRDATVCGVMVAEEATLDLSDGDVSSSNIGACVQVDGYDLGRLSNRVTYRDNGTNLVSTSLPVPELPRVEI
jgi:hypothetical protein